MMSGRLTLICVLIAQPALIGVARPPEHAWMRTVTPAGQPYFEVELAASKHGGVVEKLTLQHHLLFDGVRYFSRVFVVELESRLIPKGRGLYEWRNLKGELLTLKAEPLSNSRRSAYWRVVENIGPGEIGVMGEDQLYVYQQSRLVAAEARGAAMEVEIIGKSQQFTDSKGRKISVNSDPTGGRVTISAFGTETVLVYNEQGQLASGSGTHCGSWELRYWDGLLTDIIRDGKHETFAWGAAKYTDYEKRELPLPPVVVRTANYELSFSAARRTLRGTLSERGKVVSQWAYSFKTRAYSLR